MVKQHRGAINLAVMYSSTRLLLLPHFAATYFHMQEDKSPCCGKKTQRCKETKRDEAQIDRQKQGVKQSAKHSSREGVTIASVSVVQSACVVQLLYINVLKASVKLTTSSPGCLSSVLLTGL